MPNYIENILILHTNYIDLQHIVGNNNTSLSFKYIAPEPSNNENYDWYTWHNENWGTKWDAIDAKLLECKILEHGSLYVKYTFETAWSTPFVWLEKVAKKCPNTNIEIYWSDEDIPQSGWIKIINNQLTHKMFSYRNIIPALDFLKVYFPDKYDFYQGHRIHSDSESIDND